MRNEKIKNIKKSCQKLFAFTRTRPKPLNPSRSFACSIRFEMERKLSPEEIGKILEYSKSLQTCPTSFDGEELLLTNPAFLEDLIVQIDSPADPTTAKLKNLLRRSQEYLFDDETTPSRYFSDPTHGFQIWQQQQQQQQLGALTTYMPWTLAAEIRTRSNALSLKIEKIFDPKLGSEQEYDVKTTTRTTAAAHPRTSPPRIESWRSRNLVERTSFVPVSGAGGVLQKLSVEDAPVPYYGLGLDGSTMYHAETAPDQEYLSDDSRYVLFTATFLVGAPPSTPPTSPPRTATAQAPRQYVVNDYRPYNDDDNKPSDRHLQRGFSVKPNGTSKADLYLHGVADADGGELEIFGELDADYFYTLQVSYAPLRSASSSFYSLYRSDHDPKPEIKTSRFRSARVFEVSPTVFYVGGTNAGSSSRKPKTAEAFRGTLAELQIVKTDVPPTKAFCNFVVEQCLIANL